MKIFTITLEIADSVGPVTITNAQVKKIAADVKKATSPQRKGQSAEQVCGTRGAQLVKAYFDKLVPGRRVKTARVGRFLEKRGFKASTAMPCLSALYRTGQINRLGRGVYAAK